jgi:hypothetical protein
MRVLKKELWPYKVAVNVDDTTTKIDEIELWLSTTYGTFSDQWTAVYQHKRTDYYFRQGKDATMFSLRWS